MYSHKDYEEHDGDTEHNDSRHAHRLERRPDRRLEILKRQRDARVHRREEVA